MGRLLQAGWLALGLACALCAATASRAATQGSSGATSSGQVTISVSIASRVRVSSLDDAALSPQGPTVALASSQSVTVWSNTATRGYTVTAVGDGAGGALTLDGGAGTPPVAYTVQWNGDSARSSGTFLAAAMSGLAAASQADRQSCAGDPPLTASLVIAIAPPRRHAIAPPRRGAVVSGATYSGVLTLIVAPE
jgi:hypothetical protein